jgi:hypothetical protein
MPSPQHSVTQSPIAQLDTDTESQHLYGIITHPKSKPITTWRRGLVSTPWAKSLKTGKGIQARISKLRDGSDNHTSFADCTAFGYGFPRLYPNLVSW